MRKIGLLIAFGFFSLTLFAQTDVDVQLPRSLRGASSKSNMEHANRPEFFVGGNINSNFGQMLTINLEGGLYATDWLRIGIGPRYELYYDGGTCHAFGAAAFSEFVLVDYLVAHIGYEFLNYPTIEMDDEGRPVYDTYNKTIPCRKNIHALALGVGFQTRLTTSVGMYVQYLIYPVQSKNYHYSNFLPMFARVGVNYIF